MMKTCSKCKEDKERTAENFRRNKRTKDGLEARCKECRAEHEAEYRSCPEVKVALAEYGAKYRNCPKNKVRAAELAKINRSRPETKARISEYRSRPEVIARHAEYSAKYYYSARGKARQAEYDRSPAGREVQRRANHKRRARGKQAEHTLTTEEWADNLAYFKSSCTYCGQTEGAHIEEHGQKLHQDHFIPLTKLGDYSQNNIVPACRPCNFSKGGSDFFEWYPEQSFYSVEKENRLLEYLHFELEGLL